MRLAGRAIVVASLACLAMGGACREPRPQASTGSQPPVARAAPEDSRFTSRRQAMVDRHGEDCGGKRPEPGGHVRRGSGADVCIG